MNEDVKKTIVIGKFVSLKDFDARWARFFSRECHEFDTYLPTETVIRSPGIVVPQRGRIFNTGFYLYRSCFVVDYDWLREHARRIGEEWCGSGSYERVLLVEVFEDYGDDDHVGYEQIGYRFVGEKSTAEREGWRGTMSCMCRD